MDKQHDSLRDAWDILQHACTKFPEKLAVVDAGSRAAADGRALSEASSACTYGRLHSSSVLLASCLQQTGVCRGDRVAVCLPNSLQVVELHFACAALHAVLVNLNTSLVARELTYILQVSGAKCLVSDWRQSDTLLKAVTQVLECLKYILHEMKPVSQCHDIKPIAREELDDQQCTHVCTS